MNLNLILGNQLFEALSFLKFNENDIFFIKEDFSLLTHFKFHKHKIIFFLSAMRNYKDYLIEKNLKVRYIEFCEKTKNETYEAALKKVLLKEKIKTIKTYFIEDKFFRKRIEKFCFENKIKLIVIESPNFLCSTFEFKKYLQNVNKKPLLNSFYILMRKKFKIFVKENGKPFFDKWSFDFENRKKMPKNTFLASIKIDVNNKNLEDVKVLCEKFFSENYGEETNFYLPTTFETSKKWFEKFLEERFFNFGNYQDSIDEKTFLFHSVISPLLNSGLLSPKYIVFRAIDFYEKNKNKISFNTIEGFLRQIIGWREFMRGVYNNFDLNKNFFNHKNKLNKNWYNGETGILPLDNAIKKVVKNGYLNHIDRLMIISNIMLLCRIEPKEVYSWFMELFVDSLDWVMDGNVYGMGQFSDGGIFATKPYICGSNYILKMSNYKKDSWCFILDGLYWKFIYDNKKVFEKNQRMSMMVKILEKKDKNNLEKLFKLADNFIEKNTK